MQALNALLFPIAAPEESTAQLTQHNFVASGCIAALLQAVKTADSNDTSGQLPSVLRLRPLSCARQVLQRPMFCHSVHMGSSSTLGGIKCH